MISRAPSSVLPSTPTSGIAAKTSRTKSRSCSGWLAQPSNLWWVVPQDAGVFQGAVDVQGVQCAHPVQVWLDLEAHPERANEAAECLRKKILRWGRKRA